MANILDAIRNTEFNEILYKLLKKSVANVTEAIEEQKEEVILGDNMNQNGSPCPQLPGTILRIFIPAGAVINLLNLIEIASPSGICLILRIPILGGGAQGNLQSIITAIQQAGGTVEFTSQ